MSSNILQAGVTNQVPVSIPPGWNLDGLFFDAWLRLNHTTNLTITKHPVETGAAITDHSYSEPFRGSFEIGMTDCLNSYIPKQFPSNPTKSINAYNILTDMQRSREFLTLTSKYGTYEYILIESISVEDDYTTANAMKATINLVQIIVVDIQLIKITTNSHATDSNTRGQVSVQPLPGTLEAIQQDLKELGTPSGFNNAAVKFLKNL